MFHEVSVDNDLDSFLIDQNLEVSLVMRRNF